MDEIETNFLGELLQSLSSFIVLTIFLVGTHMSTMTDKLIWSFRLRIALRNSTVWLVLAVSAGWLLSASAVPYWLVHAAGTFLLGYVVRLNTKDLEEEIDNWRTGDAEVQIRHDGWYWTDRRDVLAALRVADFKSMLSGERM